MEQVLERSTVRSTFRNPSARFTSVGTLTISISPWSIVWRDGELGGSFPGLPPVWLPLLHCHYTQKLCSDAFNLLQDGPGNEDGRIGRQDAIRQRQGFPAGLVIEGFGNKKRALVTRPSRVRHLRSSLRWPTLETVEGVCAGALNRAMKE